MATAEAPTKSGLWDGMDVEVLGVTGEYNSGKTLFVLSIDPENTRYYDFEKSGGGYAESLGATRIDVPAAMQQLMPGGYRARDLFAWWIKDIRKIQPGEYAVIATDTIGDIESGLADYVKHTQYSEYGFKTAENFESMGGVFWAAVKSFGRRRWQTSHHDVTRSRSRHT